MKRRVLVAVLSTIALVVVAAGPGDSTSATPGAGETIRGEPWTGSPGETVPVSTLMARQRLVNWGFAGKPPRGRNKPEEEDESGEGEEASAGPGEQGGEGGDEEPVEEEAPPKTPSSSAVRIKSGAAAVAPKSHLTVPPGGSFLGAHLLETPNNFVPPDSIGSVGPSQIVVAVNGRIRAFDKDGNPGSFDVSDSTFWTSERDGLDVTDPQVEYDRLSGRWILSQINFDPSDPTLTNNRLMIAVSDGPAITSQSDFTYFSFAQNEPNPGPSARFADYPQMGVDANAVYIGTNDFTASRSFAGTTAYVIDKEDLLADTLTVTAFRGLTNGVGPGPDSPQPAHNMDPNVNAGYIIGPDNVFFGRLAIVRINNPGGTPSMTSFSLNVPATTFPEDVPAQGSANRLDALDDRLFEAMIGRDENGDLSLWTAHNIEVNASGVASTSGNRDGARWYQIGNLFGTPTLLQSGTLFDASPSNPRYFWIPSIAMNGQGHASLNSSTAGSAHFAEIASSGRLASDPPGTTEPFVITQTSTSSYNRGDNPERWGDYSQTVVDPTDNMTFWTFQEYTHGTNDWGVRVIKLQAPPPATPTTASPASTAAGQCSVAVDIEGTSTGGSGFFDPGPGFPNHLEVEITGGVTVNGVTYIDPTHITLDIDTRSATAGAQDVTIRNPDGQEITATGLLTVSGSASTPTPPCLTGTAPPSPANANSPLVIGDAEVGTTVSVYDNDSCTGSPVGTGTAAQFASPGIDIADVPDDSTTNYYATATDGSSMTSDCSSTLTGPGRSVIYVEDSTPPTVSVDAGPIGLTNDRTPTFSFSATDPATPITFQCSIDSGTPSFGSCSGPGETNTSSSPLADGSYVFRVRAIDAAGNSNTATRSFQVDATPPSLTITGGPSGLTQDATPTFTFGATDPAGPLSFLCSIDTGAPGFRTCSGAGTDTPPGPLADGAYTFRVRATDSVSNSSTATHGFTVKTSAPETTITKGPKKTRKRRPKFKFTASEPGTAFRCRLDKGAFAPCSSPFRPPKLKVGKHVFRVVSVDSLGNADPTPAVRKFKVLPPNPAVRPSSARRLPRVSVP